MQSQNGTGRDNPPPLTAAERASQEADAACIQEVESLLGEKMSAAEKAADEVYSLVRKFCGRNRDFRRVKRQDRGALVAAAKAAQPAVLAALAAAKAHLASVPSTDARRHSWANHQVVVAQMFNNQLRETISECE